MTISADEDSYPWRYNTIFFDGFGILKCLILPRFVSAVSTAETCEEPGCSHLRLSPGESPRGSRHSLLDPQYWKWTDVSPTSNYNCTFLPCSFIYWQGIRNNICKSESKNIINTRGERHHETNTWFQYVLREGFIWFTFAKVWKSWKS